MARKKITIVLSLLTLLAAGCNTTNQQPTPAPIVEKTDVTPPPPTATSNTASTFTYKNSSFDYQISFPGTFEATANAIKGDQIVTIHRKIDSADKVSPYGKITIYAWPKETKPATLEKFYATVDDIVGPPQETRYKKSKIGLYNVYGYGSLGDSPDKSSYSYFVFRPNQTIIQFNLFIKTQAADTEIGKIINTFR